MELIGLTALGLTFAVFLLILFACGCVLLFRAFRKPTPAPQAARTLLNQEDLNLEFLRRKFPGPETIKQHVPDLESLHLDYDLKREREDRIARIRKGLDAGRGPATPPNA